ncbi:hypothetical protein SAMN04487881_2308 [Marinobacter sp. es.048]|uniref:hypothetical protein n=1 Tax=Marinobacter sp. es.048 TaxID=1761795 RepID=UPI000B58A3C7|nr:hypothetical protein [Marinobacter sp. es.048]SNC74408.1 hypothetical protein SAMN04487881_2308 [Marinobacter sp. es.048]
MTMYGIRNTCVFLVFLFLAWFSATAGAQENRGSDAGILSDGKLTKEELAAAMLTAEKDLTSMLKASMSNVEQELESSAIFGPGAWMVLKDRKLKKVTMGEESENAPPSAKLQVFRASLRSLARHNKIDAALIVYPGTITKEGKQERVVVVEHEHRLGVSGLKLIPLELDHGKASFGAAISQDKSFQIFYDQKKNGV